MVITIYLIKVIARIEILKIHWILKKKENFLFYECILRLRSFIF